MESTYIFFIASNYFFSGMKKAYPDKWPIWDTEYNITFLKSKSGGNILIEAFIKNWYRDGYTYITRSVHIIM
jgi:hypothetical protein